MTGKRVGLIVGLGGAIVGISLGVLPILRNLSMGKNRQPLVATLDTNGGCVLVISEAALHQYAEALGEARKLHPGAAEIIFNPHRLEPVLEVMRKSQPQYSMVFLLPNELDVNFAWDWLRLTTEVDDDPLVDVRTGFITGRDPAAAARFVRRIRNAVESRAQLAGMAIDDLGPNPMAEKKAFYQNSGNFMIPVLGERVGLRTISHGTEAFDQERIGVFEAAGMVHFGGHGHPERVDDGVTAAQARQLKLGPCVVFNGACYTGVTGKWFDLADKVIERDVAPDASFSLALLDNNVLGYLAALHPDHGIPVYQEMEFLATHGASLGEVIKHTHDGVILAAGGKLPPLEPFTNNAPAPRCTPAEIMLKGTASRVLFGDPALVLTAAFTKPPFEVTTSSEGSGLRIRAVLKNTALKATYTDTYYSDLSSVANLFNDCARLRCKLPDGWTRVSKVEVLGVTAKSKSIKSRLVGFTVEKDAGSTFLHVQLDVPTTGYMQSDFRAEGSTVELNVFR